MVEICNTGKKTFFFFYKFKNEFKKLSKTKAKNKDSGGKVVINTQNLIKRHGGILGLCSLVSSSPYEIPDYLPDIVTYLCAFINDTAPIQVEKQNTNKLLSFV